MFEDNSRRRSGVRARLRSLKPVGRRAWLFWEDLAFAAAFEHPSRLLLIDAATGRVLRNKRLRMPPLINGRTPPFLKRRGYYGHRYVVYDSLRRVARSRPASPARAPAWPAAQPVSPAVTAALGAECLLIIGDQGPDSRFFSNAIKPMQTALKSYGLRRQYWVRNGDQPLLPAGDSPQRQIEPPDGKDLRRAASALARGRGIAKCADIMLLIAGHGTASTRDGQVQVGRVSDGEHDTDYYVNGKDVEAILTDNRDTGFKVKIDSCYSGHFVDLLGPKGKHPNLLVLETSANDREWSFFRDTAYAQNGVEWFEDPPPANPKALPDTFTAANLAGWEAFATSADEVAKAQDAGGPLLARMLERGFTLGAPADVAAAHGVTHPQVLSNLPEPPRPILKPISAIFVSALRRTTYTENAESPNGGTLDFQWALAIPGDPPCATGFQPRTPAPNEATWYHPDASEGGTCNHSGTAYDPAAGHPGTVVVTVTSPNWVCAVTYYGTMTGVGPDPYGTPGAPSEPCRRR